MSYHEPVLLNESVEGLRIKPGGVYIDATFGGGGHSKEILKRLTSGRLIAFDKDQNAGRNALENKRFQLVNMDFRQIEEWLVKNNLHKVDGLLADLGLSSHQIDTPERGFSTRYDASLDMRMDRSRKLTAATVVNHYSDKDLRFIFRFYGDLNNAGSLTRKVVQYRKNHKIETTGGLKSVLMPLSPKGRENKFFAKVFQALRIEVNDELNALRDLLELSAKVIKKGGRLAVISYHSAEDRLVKNFIMNGRLEGELERDIYGNPKRFFNHVNKKPLSPSAKEMERNSRARSARLRIAEKI